jgi:nucleoside-diphosphate-sugar epimerase
MKILVTGSEGFLGVHLVEALERDHHEVVHYDIAQGLDILDREQLSEAMVGVDACIHLAAVADLYIAEDEPSRAREINVTGTAMVLEACERAEVRLLYASTCCAYGNNDVELSSESSPVAPTEHYARTKLEGERLVLASGGHHAILRLATFYGPGMRPSLATWRFLRAAILGEPIRIHGTGEQTRCYTHVGDVCSGIIRILDRPDFAGIVNISDDRPVSVNQLAVISMQAAGAEVPTVHVQDRDGQIYHSAIDNELLRGMGWAPRWTLEEGLRGCVDEIRNPALTHSSALEAC